MPTEAEWEFAARGGNKSRGYRFAGSNILMEVLTNFGGLDEWDMLYILGQSRPNELDIHDMSSQAVEWVLGSREDYGEPIHNPGRISQFDFTEPFYLIQKGGSLRFGRIGVSTWLYVQGDSFRPEWRLSFRPDPEQIRIGGERASIRLVRKAGCRAEW